MADFTPLKRVPAYVELAEAITARILEGKIRPGELLPIEKDLAEQFAVNRSTLREGLRALEESGLVIRKGKRLEVQRPSHRALATVIGRALVLHDVSFNDIYVVTSILFPAAAELAASNATEAQKARMRVNLEETGRALENPDELARVDIEFLQLVAEASGNKALLIAIEPLSLIFYAGFVSVLSQVEVAGERLLRSHEKILQSIEDGDAAQARHWMEKHAQDFRRGFESARHSLDDPISESASVLSALQGRGR